ATPETTDPPTPPLSAPSPACASLPAPPVAPARSTPPAACNQNPIRPFPVPNARVLPPAVPPRPPPQPLLVSPPAASHSTRPERSRPAQSSPPPAKTALESKTHPN